MADSRPIGVFDSGIGGLTVAAELRRRLPTEKLIYLGDTARTPYGTKSPEVVREYSIENAEFLVSRGVKLIVVACNSASAVAIDALRERFDVPILGVVEPGARAALAATRKGRIGIIATESTVASGVYTRALRRLDAEVEIFTRACPLFVPLAEEGWVDGDIAGLVAARYLESLRESGIDTLVLGCTHYPLLRGVVGEVMGEGVAIVDSAVAVAEMVAAHLTNPEGAESGESEGKGTTSFFVTDTPERFVRVGAAFLGAPLDSAVRIERP